MTCPRSIESYILRHFLFAYLLYIFFQHGIITLLALQPMSSLSSRYWERLHLDPSKLDVQATGDKLAQIQEAHLCNICFENLAQHGAVGGLPVLNTQVIADKVLTRHRGGFCCELNGLLATFLEELGYPLVKRVPAKVCIGTDDNKDGSPMFYDVSSHLILLVTDCQGIEYFVDVGFGEPSLRPLRYGHTGVEDDQELEYQETTEGMKSRFQIVHETEEKLGKVVRLQWYKDGQWQTRLQWTVDDACRNTPLSDFLPALDFVLGKESIFSEKLICCRLTREKKMTLAGNLLKVTGPPRFLGGTPPAGACPPVTTQTLQSVEEVRTVLEESFGIPKQETSGLDITQSLQAAEEVWSSM